MKDALKIAILLNMILDLIDRLQRDHGITITPENLVEYVASRKAVREAINERLGV